MWKIIQRLLRIFKAKTNNAIDSLEKPIEMATQGIRDLKADLDKSMQSLAEVMAIAKRTERETETYKQEAIDYERKALALLQRAQSGNLELAEAERLATEALVRKGEKQKQAEVSQANQVRYNQMVANLRSKIQELKSQIAKWENELKTLKARATVSEATSKINKQLAGIDSTDTLAMLERMREKVESQEALAESYADLSNVGSSVDAEINKALAGTSPEVNEQLAQLKAKLNMSPPTPHALSPEDARIIESIELPPLSGNQQANKQE